MLAKYKIITFLLIILFGSLGQNFFQSIIYFFLFLHNFWIGYVIFYWFFFCFYIYLFFLAMGTIDFQTLWALFYYCFNDNFIKNDNVFFPSWKSSLIFYYIKNYALIYVVHFAANGALWFRIWVGFWLSWMEGFAKEAQEFVRFSPFR